MAEYASLSDAVQGGADLPTLLGLLAGMGDEEVSEMDEQGHAAVWHAVEREADVFEAVLRRSSREAIVGGSHRAGNALEKALQMGRKEAVWAVAARMEEENEKEEEREKERREDGRGETDGTDGKNEKETEKKKEPKWNPFAVRTGDTLLGGKAEALLRGPLISHPPTVDLVASLVPAFALKQGDSDPVVWALISPHASDYALRLIVTRGGSMAGRVAPEYMALVYVCTAAQHRDLATVQLLHDLLPRLSHFSPERDTEAHYADCLDAASRNPTHARAIMEYLVEQTGDEVLARCPPRMLAQVPGEECARWLVTRARDMLERASKDSNFLLAMAEAEEERAGWLAGMLAEGVGERMLVRMVRGRMEREMGDLLRGSCPRGWRWKMAKVHAKMQRCVAKRRSEWLMQAARDRQYDDVRYLAGLCSREELAKRNEDGDRVGDVAARDEDFPKDLLGLLAVETKAADTGE